MSEEFLHPVNPHVVSRFTFTYTWSAQSGPNSNNHRRDPMSDVTIKLRENGPLLVTGPVKLEDHEGGQFDTEGKDTIALCRCGATGNRPFCDGSHKSAGFEACDKATS